MSARQAATGGRGGLNNRLFSALLSAMLVLFLATTVLVLSSNVWYLAQASDTEGKTGWEIFVAALRDPEVHFAIRLSFTSAFLTMLVSMLFAVPAAYVLSRYRPGAKDEIEVGLAAGTVAVLVLLLAAYLMGTGQARYPNPVARLVAILIAILVPPLLYLFRRHLPHIWDTVLDLPIVVPPPVIGMSLLMFFLTPAGQAMNRLTPLPLVKVLNAFLSLATGHEVVDDGSSWVYTTRGIVMAQFFVACAFGVRAVKATFDTIGTRHEAVARTLGCTRRQAFFKVVLPMAASGLVAGGVMTWARAIAEFGPVLFFAGSTRWKTEVMPIGMFLMYSSGEIEKAVALVIIMIAISAVTLLTFKKLGGKGYLW